MNVELGLVQPYIPTIDTGVSIIMYCSLLGVMLLICGLAIGLHYVLDKLKK